MNSNTVVRLLSILVLIFTMGTASAADKLKVVYHVSDLEKVPFVLTNIENHIKAVGGPENVEIILVAHGPALQYFQQENNDRPFLERIQSLRNKGIEFDACGNTMRSQQITLKDLPEGFVRVDQGGVVRIAELEHQGYLYIRP
ncbi:MAG: DsrE family protein [Nitrosomonadales bacterium]